MKINITDVLKKILAISAYTVFGAVLGIIILYVYLMQNRPDLHPWHTLSLEEEFTIKSTAKIKTFPEYLAQEEKLFDELQEKIYNNGTDKHEHQLIRYDPTSMANPFLYETNWNRSFELKQENPAGGVLLLHGLSDSPYSLRELANTLHQQGNYVLGLRMPGHGTVPSGLVDASWQDMAAAVKIAVRHLSDKIGSRHLHIIGYSMGAAQAVNYSLDALQDESLAKAESMVLISPAIGVSSVAAFAIWQSRLSVIPGLDKLAWNSIGPEYDPYKYTSFAVNAGDLMYRLTLAIDDKLALLQKQDRAAEFPRVQAFISAVDATVSVSAVVDHLLDKLSNNGNQLVVFDINRNKHIIPFVNNDPEEGLISVFRREGMNFKLSLLTNESVDSFTVVEINKERDNTVTKRQLDLLWPDNIYSLSHVALPFSETNSLYGSKPENETGLHIGRMSPRGERNVLSVPASDSLRLRYNPFYRYLQQRVVSFLAE